MDIFQHLIEEHRDVDSLMQQLEKTREEQLFDELRMQLTTHMKSEERVLYRRVEGEESVRERILEAYEEHRAASRLLADMVHTQDDELWMARLRVLAEMVKHHVDEEERNLFPQLRKSVVDKQEAAALLEEYERVEESIQRRQRKAA